MLYDASLRLAAAALGVALSTLQVQTPAPATPTPSPSPEAPLPEEEVRARERMALLSISTVLQAQKAYAAENGALFDEFRCLTAPRDCRPALPADAAPFLDPTYEWLEPKLGYARKFHPGPKATAEQVTRARASATSLTAFAFTATPIQAGRTGGRAFCGDSTGRVCMRLDGREPTVKEGRCEPCLKLQ